MSWSAVRVVGAPSITHAGIPLTVKKTFLRVISTATNAAIVAIYHRMQHRPEPWVDYLVTLSRQIQYRLTFPTLSETTLKGSEPVRRGSTRKPAPSKQISKLVSIMQELHWHSLADRRTGHALDTKKSPIILSFEMAKTTQSFVFVVASLLWNTLSLSHVIIAIYPGT